MAFDRVILLANEEDSAALLPMLQAASQNLLIAPYRNLAAMGDLPVEELRRARLISFLFPDIVPPSQLARLGYGAYNFHPGPPDYPGWGPVAFAIYRGARQFGATLHHMAARVDSGPIIDVEAFTVTSERIYADLAGSTYTAILKLFARNAERLAIDPAPLPACGLSWSGAHTTRRQFAEFCRYSSTLSAAEVDRRQRAFGDGDGYSRFEAEGQITKQI